MAERSCLVCGCTDERACPEGCGWVHDQRGGTYDVCSRCVGDSMSMASICQKIVGAAERARHAALLEAGGQDGRIDALRHRMSRLEARIPHVVRGRKPSAEQLREVRLQVEPWILASLAQLLDYLPRPILDAEAQIRGGPIKQLLGALRQGAADLRFEQRQAELRAIGGQARPPRSSARRRPRTLHKERH
jgi:hypothetical protein